MAAAVSVGLYAPEAAALVLGPITVQSALGEPLRAEIDLPQITPAEAQSLQVGPASAETFRAQGMEYSATARQVQVQLHRRPDGRSVLRLRSSNTVNEPFVDLVIDARWSTGQIMRSYTMLFDPPAVRRAPAPVTAPQVAAPASSAAPAPLAEPAATAAPLADPAVTDTATATAAPRAEPVPTPVPSAEPAPRTARARRMASAPARTPRAAIAAAEDAVKVAPGDTAGRIASSHRPSGVSLDQMLVALMRSNPDAFIQSNVNRIKAGAVLQLPSADEARATPSNEARQIIALQSRDFNEFRRKLARSAPATQQAAAERSARGSVQTRTEDKRTAATAPDKLTLSKGALQGQKTTEELLAQRKQGNEASARAEELSKNIQELNRLSAASTSAPTTPSPGAPSTATAKTGATGAAATNPGITVPAPAATPAVSAPAAVPVPPVAQASADSPAATPAETPAAPSPAPASTDPAASTAPAETTAPTAPAETAVPTEAVAPAPAPAVVAIAPPPAESAAPAPTPEPEPSFVSTLLEEPMVPLAGGALLALLLGYGAYRVVQRRRNNAPPDSTFMDSRVQPDSFFGGSGGQRVDTAGSDTTMGSSSLAFTSSQLDAGGEVDPVAEADVYLAYGRDLQAEEILKEAARHTPERVSVHVKLAEIYAKRQDRKAFEATAHSVRQLTQGSGPDWARITDLGRELDPDNALYQPGGMPGAAQAGSSAASAPTSGLASTFAAAGAGATLAADGSEDSDLDFDLDLQGLDDSLTDAPPSEPVSFAEAAAAAMAASPRTPEAPPPEDEFELPALDFGSERQEPTWDAPEALPPAAVQNSTPPEPAPAAFVPVVSGPPLADIDFSMDLPPLDMPPASPQEASPAVQEPIASPGSALMEFNLDHLSLDLDTPEPSPVASTTAASTVPPPLPLSDDPLATKLALAQEFNTIGDSDGARTLIEEVIAESSGELKARAQRLLSELD